MEKRILGKTGLEVSLLGFGGFHLLEIPTLEARKLINHYLDSGGNYLETASVYGDGESERKLGAVVAERREEMIRASKIDCRDKEGARKEIERSLRNLQTDRLDILFMHAVRNREELEQILSPGGALEAYRELQEAGKVDYLGISMHGQPDVLIEALKRDVFDVVMATLNYYDRFNFPKLEQELLPLAREKGVGVVLMKPLADGYLWRSTEKAFRYAFSLPVSVVVSGMNTREMLQKDLAMARNFTPMSDGEKQKLFQEAPELGNYVCRQCAECYQCPEGIDLRKIFMLEGYYDRQMQDGDPRNPADYALRDRLRFWFQGEEKARGLYQELPVKADQCTECGKCLDFCPYGLPLIKKLSICHYKLGQDDSLF